MSTLARLVLVLIIGFAALAIAPGSGWAKCMSGDMDVPVIESVAVPKQFVPGQSSLVLIRARLDTWHGDESGSCTDRTYGCPMIDGRVEVLAEPIPNRSGESQRLTFPASPTEEPGVYQATVTLPYAARWWIRLGVAWGAAAAVIPLDELESRGIRADRYLSVPEGISRSGPQQPRAAVGLCGQHAAAASHGLWWLWLASSGMGVAVVLIRRQRLRSLI